MLKERAIIDLEKRLADAAMLYPDDGIPYNIIHIAIHQKSRSRLRSALIRSIAPLIRETTMMLFCIVFCC